MGGDVRAPRKMPLLPKLCPSCLLLSTPQPQLRSPLPLEFLPGLLPGLFASHLSLQPVALPRLLSSPEAPQPGVCGPAPSPTCPALASCTPIFLNTVPATPSCWQFDKPIVLSLVPGTLHIPFPLPGMLCLASSALGSSPSTSASQG